MSNNSKMGLLGSKQLKTNDDDKNSSGNGDDDDEKCESHKYAFYNSDNDSETYNTESLSIMDINDIIGVQTTEADSKPDPDAKNIKDDNPSNENNIVNTNSSSSNSNDISNPQLSNDSIEININNVDNSCNSKSNDCQNDKKDDPEKIPVKESSELCKSLQLIGEAYLSEDSQEFDIQEDLTEPKVVFSCKLVADKQVNSLEEINLVEQNCKDAIESIIESAEETTNPLEETLSQNLEVLDDKADLKASLDDQDANVEGEKVDKSVEVVSVEPKNSTSETKTVESVNKQVTSPKPEEKVEDIELKSEEKMEEVQPAEDKSEAEKIDELEEKVENTEEDESINKVEVAKAEMIEAIDETDVTEIIETIEISEESIEPKLKTAEPDVDSSEELNSLDLEKLEESVESPVKNQDELLKNEEMNVEVIQNELLKDSDETDIEILKTPDEIPEVIDKVESSEAVNVEESKIILEESVVESKEVVNVEESKIILEESVVESKEVVNAEKSKVILEDSVVESKEIVNVEDSKVILEESAMDVDANILESAVDEDILEMSKIDDLVEQMEVDESVEELLLKDDNAPEELETEDNQKEPEEKKEESLLAEDTTNVPIEIKSPEVETVLVKVDVEKKDVIKANEEKEMSEKVDDQKIILETLDANEEKKLEEINVEIEVETNVEEPEEEKKIETVSNVPEKEEEIEKVQEDLENALESILEAEETESNLKSILPDDEVIESELVNVLASSNDIQLESDDQTKTSDEKLPTEEFIEEVLENSIETPQNIDSLDGLLDFIPAIDDSKSKEDQVDEDSDDKSIKEPLEKISNTLMTEEIQPEVETISKTDDFFNQVIETLDEVSAKTFDSEEINQPVDITDSTKTVENEDKLLISSNNLEESEPVEEVVEDVELEEELDIPFNIDQDDKLDITDDILNDDSLNLDSGIEALQQNPEISELESAVKFLEESVNQNMDCLPNKIEVAVNKLNENLTVADGTDDISSELETIISSESISISEAEIINEAAKLENERKQISESIKITTSVDQSEDTEMKSVDSDDKTEVINEKCDETEKIKEKEKEEEEEKIETTIKKSIVFPKTSILEERLREPPKIEIPVADNRLYSGPISSSDQNQLTPKTNLLIPRDSRALSYQKMLDSPKMDKNQEVKIAEAPRKDADKHDNFENVGSPRIILKIAKSAIAECSEPRSPKSPKIRSATNSPNPDDSSGQKLGKIKLKLSKGGHPSIISNDKLDNLDAGIGTLQWHTGGSSSLSPLGMKFKLSKSGDASIIQPEKFDNPNVFCVDEKKDRIDLPLKIKLSKPNENLNECKQQKLEMNLDSPKRTESPLGMKIKLLKSGDASIISEDLTQKEIATITTTSSTVQDLVKRNDSPLGVKIKLFKSGDGTILSSELEDGKVKESQQQRMDSPVGKKMKLSKKEISSIDSQNDKLEFPEVTKRTESPIGMKIKLSKTGDASIIHSELYEDQQESSGLLSTSVFEPISDFTQKKVDLKGMKIKLSRDGATIIHPEEEKKADSPIGLKIKLSNTGNASIIQPESDEKQYNSEINESGVKLKLSKANHGIAIDSDNDKEKELKKIKSEMIVDEGRGSEVSMKRKEILTSSLSDLSSTSSISVSTYPISPSLSPVESKKMKLSQVFSDVSIASAENNSISRQQMNVINQEISITQVNMSNELPVINDKFKKVVASPPHDDCQIIESQPEVIIVNEDSNQDIMIIDELPMLKTPEIKVPKKRGRPRRIPLPQDPLMIEDKPAPVKPARRMMDPGENHERPKRTCRSQKSYAPPKRGRGRGRGKRKFERIEQPIGKRKRLDHDLSPINQCQSDLITIDDDSPPAMRHNTSELYKVLRQPLKSGKAELLNSGNKNLIEGQLLITTAAAAAAITTTTPSSTSSSSSSSSASTASISSTLSRIDSSKINQVRVITEKLKPNEIPDRQNWLTPMSKKPIDVQVIDEETRMSAEPTSRSQTPARNIFNNGNESIINEESQGSVVSTATTESEKVKVKSRRMEINFDPDEGPFTVDKIAEYEWPPDRKNETFMIQEQISQYLGVKSFKRKYPDLKRRIVDMEERNFLRENCLVSESMCDMGLTAIYSSEVLDIMCSDFPDQYEEYRKHMRERQIREHSKKQKELSAATNVEKNRIDLAEMAVQSALNWNVTFNKSRKETRRCSLDLQTFTIHVPKKQLKLQHNNKINHYPVALIPGQYTDYYREYTPAELRYYPLNTVLYGPMRPNERNLDSQSEGSQSDSDSDSSSDDSSCSSSEGTQDTEESQSTMDDVDIELSSHKDKSLKCKICLKNLNKTSKSEILIQCGTCGGHVHPSCIDLTLDMVPHIQAYAWQCTDCKTCAQCHDPADEDKMLFCDMCDRGYHIYCVGLRRVPQGRWHCLECAICASCGTREAGGINADRNSVAQWQHEYKKGDKNTRVYVSTLCVPCSKMCGEQTFDSQQEKLSV